MSRAMFSVGVLLLLSACAEPEETKIPRPRVVETIVLGIEESSSRRLFIGELQAVERTDLSFEVPGVISQLSVDLGDNFAEGQVLGRLDDRIFTLELEAVEARLRDAEARLIEAQLDFDRFSSLDGTGAVSRSAVDASKARLDVTIASVDALIAQVSRARELLDDTKLVAPYTGAVAERLAEPSQFVQPGQPIFRITGTEAGYEAVIRVPERLLANFTLGLSAKLKIKPSNLEAQGEVVEVGRSANASGLYPVTIAISEGPEERLKPGVRVEVALAVGESDQLTVPASALGAGEDGSAFVMTYDETGRVFQQAVSLGEITRDGTEILSGLRPGDIIVKRGIGLLKDGESVDPIGATVARFNP